MKLQRIALLAGIISLTTLLALAANPPAPAAPAGPVPPEAMTGLVFDGLNPDQKAKAVTILNEGSCDCGCGMKLAVCRRDDPKCPRSPVLGAQVIDLVKQGKSKEEIVKIALTPASKFVQFALDAGPAPSVGPKNAKVTILHYFDYQCPFCTRILPTLAQIESDYPDTVRVVYKMHPLAMHPNAMPAAEAALAAAAQGKFMEMHKKLFDNQRELTRE